jgi:hypothetical protein
MLSTNGNAMKIIFWIALGLPLTVLAAEDIDYFNEREQHDTPGYTLPGHEKKAPAPTTESPSKKSWGQGVMEYFERLGGAAPPQPAPAVVGTSMPATTIVSLTPNTNSYVQSQLKAKGQEIAQVRQEILQTTDGQKLQALTGTLHRLEGEYQQISGHLKYASQASTPSTIELSPIETPNAPENTMSQQSQPHSMQFSEEHTLKIQLETLEQQEHELSSKIKSISDANILSTLSSQLERVQQNKSLVTLSLQDLQRRNAKRSIGFGAALLPPANQDIAMPVPTLTPSLEQVLPSDLPTYPAGWGGFGVKDAPIQPTGKPMTAEEWKQTQSQAEANFQDKEVHTTYGVYSRPLWTPKDPSGQPQQSVGHHAAIDHRHLVEKIRGAKLFT